LDATDDDTHLATLANGLRVLVIRTPQRQTLDLSVFVHTGSQHEAARDNGISHMVEHMAFKGTISRDCQRINTPTRTTVPSTWPAWPSTRRPCCRWWATSCSTAAFPRTSWSASAR
jgi:hypothetical protein